MKFKRREKEQIISITSRIRKEDKDRLKNLGNGSYSAGLRILLDSTREEIDKELKKQKRAIKGS